MQAVETRCSSGLNPSRNTVDHVVIRKLVVGLLFSCSLVLHGGNVGLWYLHTFLVKILRTEQLYIIVLVFPAALVWFPGFALLPPRHHN